MTSCSYGLYHRSCFKYTSIFFTPQKSTQLANQIIVLLTENLAPAAWLNSFQYKGAYWIFKEQEQKSRLHTLVVGKASCAAVIACFTFLLSTNHSTFRKGSGDSIFVVDFKDVDNLVSGMAYKDTAKLLQKRSPADIMSVRYALGTLEVIKNAWISGKLRLIPGQEKFWYMACKNCQKAFKSDHEAEKPCPKCGQSDPVSYKCHIAVTITDKTETTYAEIYSPDVELLIPFTADKFRAAEEEGKTLVRELEAALEDKYVVCFIKYFDKLFRGEMIRKYPLTKIYLYGDVFYDKDVVLTQSMEDTVSGMTHKKEAIDLTNDEDDVQFFTPSMKHRIEH